MDKGLYLYQRMKDRGLKPGPRASGAFRQCEQHHVVPSRSHPKVDQERCEHSLEPSPCFGARARLSCALPWQGTIPSAAQSLQILQPSAVLLWPRIERSSSLKPPSSAGLAMPGYELLRRGTGDWP